MSDLEHFFTRTSDIRKVKSWFSAQIMLFSEGKSKRTPIFIERGSQKIILTENYFNTWKIVLNHVSAYTYWPCKLLVRPISAGMALKNITKY